MVFEDERKRLGDIAYVQGFRYDDDVLHEEAITEGSVYYAALRKDGTLYSFSDAPDARYSTFYPKPMQGHLKVHMVTGIPDGLASDLLAAFAADVGRDRTMDSKEAAGLVKQYLRKEMTAKDAGDVKFKGKTDRRGKVYKDVSALRDKFAEFQDEFGGLADQLRGKLQHRDNDGNYAEFNVKLRSLDFPEWVDPVFKAAGWDVGDLMSDLVSDTILQLRIDLEDAKVENLALSKDIILTGRSGGWLLVPLGLNELEGIVEDASDANFELERVIDALVDMPEEGSPEFIEGDYDDMLSGYTDDVEFYTTALADWTKDAKTYESDYTKTEKLVKESKDTYEKQISSDDYWYETLDDNFEEDEIKAAVETALINTRRFTAKDLPKQLQKLAPKGA